MQLVTYSNSERSLRPRAGYVDSLGRVVDCAYAISISLQQERLVQRAGARELAESIGGDVLGLLRSLPLSLRLLREGAALLDVEEGEHAPMFDLAQVTLSAPVPKPGKIVHTGANFDTHRTELATVESGAWRDHDWKSVDYARPLGFLQSPDAVVGPEAEIVKPSITSALDYEIEVAAIIGHEAHNVPVERALEHIAGFTIFNDISARDIQAQEHAQKVIYLGKSIDTFCPMGPYLVTTDEITDVDGMGMQLLVNGSERQSASTADMKFSFAELVSYWSQATLQPGDIVTSGTPGGVAAFRKPDPEPYYLKAGDVVEARVADLGVLRNVVVDEVGQRPSSG